MSKQMKACVLSLGLLFLLMAGGQAAMVTESDESTESDEPLQSLMSDGAKALIEKANLDRLLDEVSLDDEEKEEAKLAAQPTKRELDDDLDDENDDGIELLNLLLFNSALPLPKPDDHQGDLSSQSHGIPEPLSFDLVRPLGAKKGELEVNTLFMGGWHTQHFSSHWAPEVEYTFRDGMSVEFELPMANLKAEALKFAFQATLPSKSDRFIHGVQCIKQYGLHSRQLEMSLLHITGFRLTKRLSLVSINGAHNANIAKKPDLSTLMNHSLFYHCSDKVTVGLETNLFLKKRQNSYLFLPQIHLELSKRYSIQLGAGFRREASVPFSPVVGVRLIRS